MAPGPTGYVGVTFRVYQEDGQYTAECIELGVATCGDTLDEAFHGIHDAVDVYLGTLDDVGELWRVLDERGIPIHLGEPPDLDQEVSVRARLREFVSPQTVRVPAPT